MTADIAGPKMDQAKDALKTAIPLKQRDKSYYRMVISPDNLPPGTDDISDLEGNGRLPPLPPVARRPLPDLPPESERQGKWIDDYLSKARPMLLTANILLVDY